MERAVAERKIDAVTMGFYGMSHFFDSAPEDSGLLRARLEKDEQGEWQVAVRSADLNDAKVLDRIESEAEDLGLVQ